MKNGILALITGVALCGCGDDDSRQVDMLDDLNAKDMCVAPNSGSVNMSVPPPVEQQAPAPKPCRKHLKHRRNHR